MFSGLSVHVLLILPSSCKYMYICVSFVAIVYLIFVYLVIFIFYVSVIVDSDDDDSDSEMAVDPQQVCSVYYYLYTNISQYLAIFVLH